MEAEFGDAMVTFLPTARVGLMGFAGADSSLHFVGTYLLGGAGMVESGRVAVFSWRAGVGIQFPPLLKLIRHKIFPPDVLEFVFDSGTHQTASLRMGWGF